MNRFNRKDTTLFRNNTGHNGDERRALIDDQELCDDEINLFSASPLGIRHRQQSNRVISTDTNNLEGGHELRALNGYNNSNKIRDIISEPFVEFTHYDIQPGDSLQSVCLRYACSINQVKRLNNLMTDQEFYGLRKIKLPLGKLGLLEDILKQQTNHSSGNNNNNDNFSRQWSVNSPGSALSVSTKHNPQFKPLLSPGFSSDRINELNRASNRNINSQNHLTPNFGDKDVKMQHNHSHSFSSMRDFASTNIDIEPEQFVQNNIVNRQTEMEQRNFIKSNLDESQNMDIESEVMASNEKVFEDLDYHVERVKAVAETYDQRATELVNRIHVDQNSSGFNFHRQRVSRIPEIFFCNESFGLNYKKLIVFIFVVCLVVPLVYINQSTNIVTTQT